MLRNKSGQHYTVNRKQSRLMPHLYITKSSLMTAMKVSHFEFSSTSLIRQCGAIICTLRQSVLCRVKWDGVYSLKIRVLQTENFKVIKLKPN